MTVSVAKPLAVLLAMTALTGCMVGPDYRGPPRPALQADAARSFHRAPIAQVSAGPPAARWWETLNDPELNRLVEAALARSPDVKAAEARLRQSRALLSERRRDLLPAASASGGYIYADGLSRALGGSGGAPLKLYNAGFDASWELDLFGGLRRAEESADAQTEAVQADLEDLKVSLAAETADAYLALRDQQQRRAIVEDSIGLESRMVDLAAQRKVQGVESDLDLTRLRQQLDSTRASLVPLQSDIDASLDRLAALTGREPGTLDAELSTSAALPDLPAEVAVGDPVEMLRRRPDIRAAERRLKAQNAVIGERVADLYPKINLIGLIGWGAPGVSHLFDNTTSLAAPTLQWNALDFGRTRARIHQAQAGRDEAAAQYESTVLKALQDAETSLSHFGHAREHVVALARVDALAARAAALTRQRQVAGVASVTDVLDTERTRLTAEENLASARAQLDRAYVALHKSLGLGWRQDSRLAEQAQQSMGAPAAPFQTRD
jgi:NodT family efflux transporter outer membrane factor (OMF) lipoprotein